MEAGDAPSGLEESHSDRFQLSVYHIAIPVCPTPTPTGAVPEEYPPAPARGTAIPPAYPRAADAAEADAGLIADFNGGRPDAVDDADDVR